MGTIDEYAAYLYLLFAGIFPIVVGWLFFASYARRGDSDWD